MRLWHTKTVWEKLARKDPYWAVLTDPDKTENRWEISAFFATGRQTVETDMRMIAAEAPTMRTERVLDFGCGVGRLSQGLATHFDHVDGVDISATMIDLAREHNQHADRVRYHLNAASDLRIFPDHHFDLIYSVITLQHIPAPLIPGYLTEFARVCRPGGLIFFQLPTQVEVHKFKFSYYPPTLWKRLKRVFLKISAIKPEMSMNSLKKDQVLAILAKFDVNPIHIKPYQATGHLESWPYLLQTGLRRDM